MFIVGYFLVGIIVFRVVFMRIREINYQDHKDDPNNVEDQDVVEAVSTGTMAGIFWPIVLTVLFISKVVFPLVRMALFPRGMKPKSQRRDEAIAAKKQELKELEAAIELGRKLVEEDA